MNISKVRLYAQNLVLVLLGLLPVLFFPQTWISTGSLKVFTILILATCICAGFLIAKIKKDSFYISSHILFISLAILITSFALATIFSNNSFISLIGRQISPYSFFGIVSLLAFAYIIYSLFDNTSVKQKLFFVLFVSGIIAIVINLLFIILPFLPSLGYFTSSTINTIGTWYDLGLYSLFIVLSSILVLQFLSHIKLYKILGLTGLVSGLILLIIVNSVPLLIFSAIGALILIVRNALYSQEQKSESRVSYSAVTTLILSVTFLLVGAKTGVFINSWFNIQSIEPRPSISSTIHVAKEAFVQEPVVHKIFGVGLDRFDTAWMLYRPIDVNQSAYWDLAFRQGYSTLTTLIINTGIFGALSVLCFILISVWYALRIFFGSIKQKTDDPISIYFAFMYLFFLTAFSIYTPSWIHFVLMIIGFALLVSTLSQSGVITYKKIAIDKTPRTSFVYILSLIVLLIGFIYIAYIQISQYSSQFIYERASIQYAQTGDINYVTSEIQKAMFIFSSDVYSQTLTDIGLISIEQILQNKNLDQEQATIQFQALLRSTIQYAQTSLFIDNKSYVNYLKLLNVYKNLIPLGVEGAKSEALRVVSEIEKIMPQNPSVSLEKARVYALAKEYDTAIDEIKNAIELKPNYVDAAFLLSQIQVEKGDIDEAVNSIKAAISIDQYNPNLWFRLGLLYFNKKEFNSAVKSFEEAVVLSPNFANAKYFLGLAYYKNNRTTDAIGLFENLNKQIPENQEIKTILETLKSGQDPFEGMEEFFGDSPEKRESLPLEDEELEVIEE